MFIALLLAPFCGTLFCLCIPRDIVADIPVAHGHARPGPLQTAHVPALFVQARFLASTRPRAPSPRHSQRRSARRRQDAWRNAFRRARTGSFAKVVFVHVDDDCGGHHVNVDVCLCIWLRFARSGWVHRHRHCQSAKLAAAPAVACLVRHPRINYKLLVALDPLPPTSTSFDTRHNNFTFRLYVYYDRRIIPRLISRMSITSPRTSTFFLLLFSSFSPLPYSAAFRGVTFSHALVGERGQTR